MLTKCTRCSSILLGEVSYCSRCGKPVELFFLHLPVPKIKLILENLQNYQDGTRAFAWNTVSKPKPEKVVVELPLDLPEPEPEPEPTVAPIDDAGSVLTNPEIVKPTKIIDETNQEYESDAALPIVRIDLAGEMPVEKPKEANAETVPASAPAQPVTDQTTVASARVSEQPKAPAETAVSQTDATIAEETISIFPETLGELEQSTPPAKALQQTTVEKEPSEAGRPDDNVPVSQAKQPDAPHPPAEESTPIPAAASQETVAASAAVAVDGPTFSRIKNIDDYPDKFDYLTFPDDRGSQDKGYQVLGKCKDGDYPCLVFPTPELSFAQMIDLVPSKEHSELQELLQARKYWDSARLLKKHFANISYQQCKGLIKKFAQDRNIKLRAKIDFALPKIASVYKKEVLKTLREGKTLEAIYAWRKQTGLGLQESREHIAYLCEKEKISYNPTQHRVVPALLRHLHKPESKGGWLLWILVLLVALALTAYELGFLQRLVPGW